jgi:hypothetical protein
MVLHHLYWVNYEINFNAKIDLSIWKNVELRSSEILIAK